MIRVLYNIDEKPEATSEQLAEWLKLAYRPAVGVTWCGQQKIYVCTRPEGHDGNTHIACGVGRVFEVWEVLPDEATEK